MKHLLNFEPTVKHRKGSSFMFKTILSLLYGIPILLGSWMAFQYLGIESQIGQLNQASERLEQHHEKFRKTLSEGRPDPDELKEGNRRLLSYQRAMTAISFSWARLLDSLEQLIPDQVRLVRVRIKPESFMKLSLEGNSKALGHVTEFLRKLFDHPEFRNPRLTRHTLATTASGPEIVFNLEVNYFPFGETRP